MKNATNRYGDAGAADFGPRSVDGSAARRAARANATRATTKRSNKKAQFSRPKVQAENQRAITRQQSKNNQLRTTAGVPEQFEAREEAREGEQHGRCEKQVDPHAAEQKVRTESRGEQTSPETPTHGFGWHGATYAKMNKQKQRRQEDLRANEGDDCADADGLQEVLREKYQHLQEKRGGDRDSKHT